MWLWRVLQRMRGWSLSGAVGVSLVLGTVLGQSSLATAQQQTPQSSADPAFFPATGYRINSPAVLDYFLRHGGVRTFGYPVSNEFALLGNRVQLFQRSMLQIQDDSTIVPANILSSDMLPITHIDGLSLPAEDPDMLAAAPSPDAPDFVTQALAFVNVYVPDSWNGLPVNFQSTFLSTVTCADAYGTDPCDPSQLPELDLQMWGLPTSLPTSDPLNSDFVYQRFQRGIMHFSRATGLTQGLLLGDWLKRIIVGVDLSPDLNPEMRHSRLFAQYAPSRPLALDRPADLPDTSLADAFRGDTLIAANQGLAQAEPTLPTNVAQTATAVAMTSTAIAGTQVALSGQQNQLTATALVLTATASALNVNTTPTPSPVGVVSNIPVVNVGCLGDEQMWFVPRKPNIGVHVQISVTSQRHHDVRAMALGGPLDSGPVVEHVGPLGFIWTWTVAPTAEAFYQWTFYADGLRPCITSGFNAYAPLGATATPTETPEATHTPGPTATATPQPQPNASGFAPHDGTCGTTVTINGTNFGTPQNGSTVPSNGQVLFGSRSAQVLSWTDRVILIAGPPPGTTAGQYSLTVVNSGGASIAPGVFNLTVAAPTSTTSSSATSC